MCLLTVVFGIARAVLQNQFQKLFIELKNIIVTEHLTNIVDVEWVSFQRSGNGAENFLTSPFISC
jgi:hypothetical protein